MRIRALAMLRSDVLQQKRRQTHRKSPNITLKSYPCLTVLVNVSYFNYLTLLCTCTINLILAQARREKEAGSGRQGLSLPLLFPTSDRKLKVYRAAAAFAVYHPDLLAEWHGLGRQKQTEMLPSNRDSVIQLIFVNHVRHDPKL